MLSKTCEYALRAMIFLARDSRVEERIPIKEIMQETDAPELFVAKIMQKLSREGYVDAAKGRNGGYLLTPSHLNTSLAQIIRCIDGDKMFNGCGLGLAHCSEAHPCPIHHRYKVERQRFEKLYSSILLKEFRENKAYQDLRLKEINF